MAGGSRPRRQRSRPGRPVPLTDRLTAGAWRSAALLGVGDHHGADAAGGFPPGATPDRRAGNQAIRLNPNFAFGFYNRGLALRALGQQARAAADLAKARQLDPNASPRHE